MIITSKKFIICFSLLALIILGSIHGFFHFESPFSLPSDELSHLKTSEGEIVIITPENKTYTKPDSGYFPGTYGFENDEDGTIPEDWVLSDDRGGTCQVISELGGHKKVVEIHDDDNYFEVHLETTFTPQTSGSIEWWWRTTGTSVSNYFELHDASSRLLSLQFDESGYIQYYTSSAWSDIKTYNANQWYLMRIDFNSTSDTYDIYVDGTQEVDDALYGMVGGAVEKIFTGSGGATYNFYSYYDAIGFSWEDYDIGENLNEGLLLSYDTGISLDWQGYSLDGQANRTIQGNTTIPMPNDGQHRIQVFGNDSLGDIYGSNMRYFSVHHINIITPEDKTYTEPDSGYYPGTYGFENDDNGAIPAGWIDTSQTYASVQVIEELGGHKKVLECYSGSETESYVYLKNYFEPQTDGTIEWWWRKSSTQSSAAFILIYSSTGEDMIQLGMDWYYEPNTVFYISPAGNRVHTTYPYSDNTWIHMRLAFNCLTDTWSLWIDGDLYLDDIAFKLERTADTINRAMFWSYDGGNPTLYYVDAVGYSWDSDYDVGDNLNEGLLLSYENSTNLDWQGYSLDGEANRTIYGNTTIPMPADGQHRIQVFGNDTLGAIYASELRYFDVDASLIEISIISPIFNELYQTTPPDFEIYIDDPDLNSTWYSLDGMTNIPFSGFTGTIEQAEWNKFSNGTVSIDFYANDSINRISHESVTVRKDILGPNITVNSPQDDDLFGHDAPAYDLSIIEFNLDSMWYSFDYGATVLPLSSLTGTLDQAEWNSKGSGYVTIRFYANDTLGHETSTDVTIIKDVTDPIITIDLPTSIDIYGELSPQYNISIIESYLNSYWYTLDGGITNISISSLTGNISQLEWDKFGNGTISIEFYAKDEVGNEGFAAIIVRKDIISPIINIISPQDGDVTGFQPPIFELSLVEPNADAMWYTLDGGITNYTFTQLTGQIDEVEWIKYGHGSVQIRFYVRDKAGNIAYSEIEIEKDLIAPIITIISPEIGNVYSELPPLYEITIDEENLDSYWYSFDGGVTNYSITELTGITSDSAWEELPNGYVTLTFYAMDEVGNIGQDSVIITKYIESPTPPGIPGYDVYLIIGILSITTMVLIKARKKYF